MSEYILENYNKLSKRGMIALIPRSFKPFSEIKPLRRGFCAHSVNGWIAFYNSKDYLIEPNWRVKPYAKVIKPNFTFWCFALDIRGILLISTNIIEDFCTKNNIPQTPSGQWKLGIKENDGKYYLFSKFSLYDVTDCFIPSINLISKSTN